MKYIVNEPEPSPSPGPDPNIELSEDGKQAVNKKKLALRIILDFLEKAVEGVGADYPETGKKAPSESLTDGLGGDGSVWKSTLADKMHADLAGILGTISSCFSSEKEKVRTEWNNEPRYVDKTDTRARGW